MPARKHTPRTRPAARRLTAAAALAAPALLGASLPAAPAMADGNTILIDFTEDKPVDFQSALKSVDHAGVTFCSISAAGTDIVDFTPETDGQGVYARGRGLAMVFDEPVDTLRATFGGDQGEPYPWISTTGEAILTLFSGATQVAEQRVPVNADDAGNQTIAQHPGGPTFNRATLRYEDVTMPSALNLGMVADNFHVGQAVVGAENPSTQCHDPEPETNGSCTVRGTSGNDELRGTRGDDVICAGAGDDVVLGLEGNDIVYAGPGRDVVRGGPGPDVVYGGTGQDVLHGHRGGDVLYGERGADKLFGDRGQDRGFGGDGRDVARSVERVTSASVARRR